MNFEETKTYIETHYNVIQYNNGHVKTICKDAGISEFYSKTRRPNTI